MRMLSPWPPLYNDTSHLCSRGRALWEPGTRQEKQKMNESAELRKRVAELETAEAEPKRVEEERARAVVPLPFYSQIGTSR